jgi:acetate kinase
VSRAADAILVLNAGSSSLKFCAFGHGPDGSLQRRERGQVSGIGTRVRFEAKEGDTALERREWPAGEGPDHGAAIDHVLDFLALRLGGARLAAVGHRIVHGGTTFAAPVLVDRGVLARLHEFDALAPLHQPHNLAAVERILERHPEVLNVGCFDTAFHRSAPEIAQLYALPGALAARGVRRYGFHGLSYEYVAARLVDLDPRAAAGRTVVLHLGNGASMCALLGGRSVATTMGFTALEGLPMGTRCGSLDPGVLLYLMDVHGYGARELERLLYHESGLLGVSGVSSDMRALAASAEPAAARAIDLFVYRIGRELGSLAAALGGLDGIVFTGGIGENQALLRERVCRDAAWLGLDVDVASNLAQGPRISAAASKIAAWVVPTDEEAVIARHTAALLAAR